MESTDFSELEVEELATLFRLTTNGLGGRLLFRDLRALLFCICPRGAGNVTELLTHLHQVTGRAARLTADGDVDGDTGIVFLEFLRLMHRLLELHDGISSTMFDWIARRLRRRRQEARAATR
mmetsp:Transcript_10608/g.32143  ORF Transcript_10608/g.32143 Transcript_10608/m.32143 type:complete len:122 (+) Transcript_10608:2430-2795(+)